MIVLALDTATPATVAGVSLGGRVFEARDDPAPGARPGHAAHLLELAESALSAAGADWAAVERIGVGTGPGGFTGLRIGVATARALAQAHDLELVGVSSLAALARPVQEAGAVVAAIDARRGEAFAAGWSAAGEPLLAPGAYPPAELEEAIRARFGAAAPLAVGDGALRYRDFLEAAGAVVPAADDPRHRIGADALCALAAAAEPVARDALRPDYVREPDAKPPAPR